MTSSSRRSTRRRPRQPPAPRRFGGRGKWKYIMVKCKRAHQGTPAHEPTRAAVRFHRKGCSYLAYDGRYHPF